MALVVKDRVKETTTTTGTGTVTLAGASTGFQSFSVIGDGNTTYYAIVSGNDWEVGIGTYTASGTTLSRDTVLESSNSGSAITLSGTSDVFCTYAAEKSVYQDGSGNVSIAGNMTANAFSGDGSSLTGIASFASGTAMMFVQTAAPTGWTKSTAHDNKALRVVSGTASSGGSVAFTTAFASQSVSGTVGSTTLTTSQIPSHAHSTAGGGGGSLVQPASFTGASQNLTAGSPYLTGNAGGGGSHNHSFTGTAINLAVQYVDVIIATKD